LHNGGSRSIELLVNYETQIEIPYSYPNLEVARNITQRALHRPPSGEDERKFNDLVQTLRYDRTIRQFIQLSRLILNFNEAVEILFPDVLEDVDVEQGIPLSFQRNEIGLIERANRISTVSSTLYQLLASPNSRTCRKFHMARIHLSGFREPDVDLLIDSCQGSTWHHAKCRR
jgi:hypothetical protein